MTRALRPSAPGRWDVLLGGRKIGWVAEQRPTAAYGRPSYVPFDERGIRACTGQLDSAEAASRVLVEEQQRREAARQWNGRRRSR